VILDSDWEAEFCHVAEFTDVYRMETDFEARVEAEFNRMIEGVTHGEG